MENRVRQPSEDRAEVPPFRPGIDFPEPYRLRLPWLCFADPQSENRFAEGFRREALYYSRLGLIVSLVLVAASGAFEAFLSPQPLQTLYFPGYALSVPLLALALALTLIPAVQHRLDWLLFTTVQLFALAVLARVHLTEIANLPLHYASLLVVLLFNYSFLRMRFPVATASGWTLVLVFLLLEAVAGTTPGVLRSAWLYLFGAANLAGMAGLFLSELAMRRGFVRNEQIEQLTTTDPLTGLPNRRETMNHLDQELERAQRFNEPLSVAIIDVDGFRQINERFGHDPGDSVLKQLVRRWSATLRDVDTLGRVGGEEFMLIMPHTDADGAMTSCERLRHALADHPFYIRDEPPVTITVSIGLTTVSGRNTSPDQASSQASSALHMAKHCGRNTVRGHR